MDKRIYEPGYLHCFLNGLITLHLREEVTRVDFEQIGFGSVSCCDRWTMKCYLEQDWACRRAGWNAADELIYSCGVTPLLVNSSVGNSCYFLASLQYFLVEPWLLDGGSKSTDHNHPAVFPPSPVFPSSPLFSLWCQLVVLEEISFHFNYSGSFCPGFEKLA